MKSSPPWFTATSTKPLTEEFNVLTNVNDEAVVGAGGGAPATEVVMLPEYDHYAFCIYTNGRRIMDSSSPSACPHVSSQPSSQFEQFGEVGSLGLRDLAILFLFRKCQPG